METLEAIYTRYSCREYTDEQVSDEDIKKILDAALCAPTACNTRSWSFIVVKDRETLLKMAGANGTSANALKTANFAVMIVCDMKLTFERCKDYWIIDGAIAGENMCIAANSLGIGSLWLGTYPQEAKVNNQKALFNLPENIIPHSILAFGYPKDKSRIGEKNKGLNNAQGKIHWGKW